MLNPEDHVTCIPMQEEDLSFAINHAKEIEATGEYIRKFLTANNGWPEGKHNRLFIREVINDLDRLKNALTVSIDSHKP